MSGNISRTEIDTLELLVCRGCLGTDVRLYDMSQNQLMEAYCSLLSGAQVSDDLPHYLCSYCATLLVKCNTFRTMCIEAQTAFRDGQSHNSDLSINKIKHKIISNLEISDIQIINIHEHNSKHNGANIASTEMVNHNNDLKIECDSDTNHSVDENNVRTKSHIENQINYYDTDYLKELLKDNASDTSLRRKEKLPENIPHRENRTKRIITLNNPGALPNYKEETIVSNKQTTLKLEDVEIDCKSNIIVEEFNSNNSTFDLRHKSEANFNLPIAIENTNASNSDEDNVSIADLCKKGRVTKNKVKKGNKAKPRQVKANTEKLSKLYNMEDIDLSKEDQLKEFEDRKNSVSYLQATYKCNVCYKGFLMEETYNSHMLIHDDKSGKYVCDICHCHFMSKSRIMRHRSNHKKRYTCKQCGFVTKYLSQAKEHFKWHGGVKDKCKYCGKGFSGQSTYYFHLKVSHPTSEELVRCEICEESCNGPVGLGLHEKRAHKEMRSPECLCGGCGTQFYCSNALKAHRDAGGACSPRAKYCVRCGGAFRTQLQLEVHEAEQRKPRTSFKCEVCSKIFKGVTSYKTHMRTHSVSLIRTRADKKVKKRAVCEICGNVLANKNLLKQHHANKHSTESPYQCAECPKSFHSALNLQLHTRTHSGERPYRCPHCSKAFKTYTNMKRHKLVHSSERQHSCEICGKAFKTKCDAKTHVKSVHMKIPMPPRIRRRNKKNEQLL